MSSFCSYRRFRIDTGRHFVNLDVDQLVDALNSLLANPHVDVDARYHLEARRSTDESVFIHVIDKDSIWKEIDERFSALEDPNGMVPSNVDGDDEIITQTQHLMHECADRYCEGFCDHRDDALWDEIDHYLQGLRINYCHEHSIRVDDDELQGYMDGIEVEDVFEEDINGPGDEALRDEVQKILESLKQDCAVYASARRAFLEMCHQDDLTLWISIDVETFQGEELEDRIKYWFCTRAIADGVAVEDVQHFMKEHKLHGCDFDLSESKRAELLDFLSDMAFK